MNSWAEKKCLTALMKLKGVKDGEWFSLNGHEYVVRAGELYTRAPEPAPMCTGMMLEDDAAINQYTFTPQKGDFYHYLVLNGDAGQIERFIRGIKWTSRIPECIIVSKLCLTP